MAELPVRERIVREARGLLRQEPDGRGLSMDRLARAAGVSRATLYRYFPSKAALLEELAPGDGAALADTRAKILEASLAVFCERGIHAATLPEVARRAGLSLSGLHWHFRNKDELVAGLAEYLPLLPTIAAEAAVAGSVDLELQLQRIAQVALGAMRRYRGLLRLAICEATQYPDVARLAATHTIGRGLPLLAQVFEEHQRRGDLRPGPARVRAQAFMSMLLMLAILRPAFGHLWEADDAECAREYVQIVLRGVLAEQDGPPTADRRPPRRVQPIPLDDADG
jgi:AcrR family transcriptional regulator